jgi:hypothetical protein
MSTELENDVAGALRFRAGEVADTSCPPLGVRVSAAPARRGWLIPVAAAAVAVVGLGGAAIALTPGDSGAPAGVDVGVDAAQQAPVTEVYYSRTMTRSGDTVITEFELWQGQGRTDAWQRKGVAGGTIKDGRVVDDGTVKLDYATDGECYPAPSKTDALCTTPGAWFAPTPEFLAGASRDPAVIRQQLHDEAVAEEQRRTGPRGDFTQTGDTFSDENLTYLSFNYLRSTLTANGLPDDLKAVLHDVIAAMPNIQVTPDMANLLGERGTGYSLPDHDGTLLTVIFNADGDYIGSQDEAVAHGMAPGLGAAPSRMLD